MLVDSERWIELIAEAGERLSIDLSRDQIGQFSVFAHSLLTWNQKINLTAITDPVEVAVKHFLDSVAPLALIPTHGELLDIGTGGGFPGIPLKIMRPEQPMTLIDGTRKKINFVKHAIRELGLMHIEALHQRAEVLGEQDGYAGRFGVIVSRAVADLKVVAQLAVPMLAEGGTIVVYKGPGEPLPDLLRINAPKGLWQGATLSFQVSSTAYKLPTFGDRRRVVLLKATPQLHD